LCNKPITINRNINSTFANLNNRKMTFEELGLKSEILQAVAELGFTAPTPVQEQAIPILIGGEKDFIGLAQTGTGKTAAFGLPLLQQLQNTNGNPEALVICPTRELCMQITRDLVNFKRHLPNTYVTAVYGGTSISQQIRDLQKGSNIVVATPGRLIDLIERKAINLGDIKYVVLDEADEMLNMGFKEDIEFVLKYTTNRMATWLFSATMPPEIRKVSKKYMDEPAEISIGKMNTANVNIDHQYFSVPHRHRYETLKRLIDFNPGIYGIIFTRTRRDAQEVTEQLTRDGYDIDALHGELSQGQRDQVMRSFRDKSLQLLVATDVAARGIDVAGVTHVINFELPDDTEVYTHRSGRTGRAGNLGICMSIITPREMYKLRDIEKLVQARFTKLEIPSGTDVCRKQFFSFMNKLHDADISATNYETYLPMITEKFADMSKEEVLTRMASLEFDRFLKYYENAEDLNKPDIRQTRSDKGVERGSRGGDRVERKAGGRADRRDSRTGDRDSRGGDRESRGGDRGRDSRSGDRGERGASRFGDRDSRSSERGRDARGADRNPRERAYTSDRGGERSERAPRERFTDTQGRSFGSDNGDYKKLFVNLGAKDGFYKSSFLQYILDMSDVKKEALGKIDMRDMTSWVEVDKSNYKQMMSAIDGKSFKGRKIRMNEADSITRDDIIDK
jgi:ATP-dependent RNA helicase DeaD